MDPADSSHPPAAHSVAWYARLATLQRGYYYPQRSILGAQHGEDVFRAMVFDHLRPDLDVLEAACAQGDLALAMAPRCRSVLGYDVTAAYIDLARAAALERGLGNARFVVHNSSSEANGGRPKLPAADHSVDLFVNSKGPFHFIADAPRVGRRGAVLLMLVPEVGQPAPWEDLLPPALRWQWPPGHDPHWARKTVEQRLGEAGLRLHSWWDFDVPEWFPDPQELYAARTFGFARGEVPSFEAAAPALERVFQQFAGPQGLEIRRLRHIWKALLPG